MGNFALELNDSKTIDIVKIDDKTFRTDIYDADGNREISIDVDSNVFIEWVLSGIC